MAMLLRRNAICKVSTEALLTNQREYIELALIANRIIYSTRELLRVELDFLTVRTHVRHVFAPLGPLLFITISLVSIYFRYFKKAVIFSH